MRASSLSEALDLANEPGVVLADHAEAGGGLLVMPKDRCVVIMLRPEERAAIDGYRRSGFCGYLIKPLRRASVVLRVLAAAKMESADAVVPEDERIAPWLGEASQGGTAGARILLAEDNPVNAMLARTFLKREGCEIDHVTDGESAIAAASGTPYDLVLMDLRMPGVGGMEATRRLRAAGVSTPVVALTADAFEDDRLACLAAGMDDFVVKPLDRGALRRILGRWIKPRWTPAGTQVKLTG
jgi:CheY-like chemotaxis protein